VKCSILKNQYSLDDVYEENSDLKRIKRIFVDPMSNTIQILVETYENKYRLTYSFVSFCVDSGKELF